MRHFNFFLILFALSIVSGFILPDITFYILQKLGFTNISIKFTFVLTSTILLPLNHYIRLQPLLDSSKLAIGLRRNEINRIKEITKLKKKQSKVVMLILLVLTLLPFIINSILSAPIDFLTRLLVGASIANIVYVFYGMNISEEISEFERDLALKVNARNKIAQVEKEINATNK